MTISERTEQIRKDLTKKNWKKYAHRHITELLKIESECRRNIAKKIRSPYHKLQFKSFHLELIATTINTKLNRLQKELHYSSIDVMFKEIQEPSEKTYNKKFEEIIEKTKRIYYLKQKLDDLHYLFGTLIPTLKKIEGKYD